MPRSNWKGHISFGLVSIPIILTNSVDPSSAIAFKQINKKTGNPIKYKRVDSETGKEVAWGDITRGYQYDKEIILPVEDDELKKVAGDNARTVAIEEFIDKENIDFLRVEHTYYLSPDKKGEKGYVILREALKASKKVGIAKVIISTKEYLAAISVLENALVLYLLHYEDEIRQLSELNIPSEDIQKYKVTKTEVQIAKKLIDSMTKKWKPEKYEDEYKLAVEDWLDKKMKSLPKKGMQKRSSAKQANNAISFVDLLKKSLQSDKSNNGKKPRVKMPAHKSTKRPSQRHTTHH